MLQYLIASISILATASAVLVASAPMAIVATMWGRQIPQPTPDEDGWYYNHRALVQK